MDNEKLALELLHELKSSCRRWFISFIIAIVMLFAINLTLLYAWNLPNESESTTISSDDNSNANYINGQGDITNCGKN